MLRRAPRLELSLGVALALFAGSSKAPAAPGDLAHPHPHGCGGAECVESAAPAKMSFRQTPAMAGGRVQPLPVIAAPGAQTVALTLEGAHTVIIRRSAETASAEGTTWSGTVEETGESALLMWWKDGRFTGVLGYKGRIYSVANSGSKVSAVIEGDAHRVPDHAAGALKQSADAFGRKPSPAPSGAAPLGQRPGDLTVARASVADPAARPVPPFADAERRALEAKVVTIDLMMVYTRKAASHYIIGMADLIARAVEETNASFRNSGVGNVRLRLVHTEAIDYDEGNGGHFEHLYRMVDGLGPFESVHRLREEKRADIVGMVIDDSSGCGLSTRVAPDPEEAFFVVHHSCAAITYSIAHEIGHILGARHDRHTDEIDTPFPYGHGHVNADKWRDIMSYHESCDGCRRILHWSNPRVVYEGQPTGTEADDTARVILEQAERVARFR